MVAVQRWEFSATMNDVARALVAEGGKVVGQAATHVEARFGSRLALALLGVRLARGTQLPVRVHIQAVGTEPRPVLTATARQDSLFTAPITNSMLSRHLQAVQERHHDAASSLLARIQSRLTGRAGDLLTDDLTPP